MSNIALAVQGGAYSIPDELVEGHAAGCRRALEAGWRRAVLARRVAEALERGEAPREAAEGAIGFLKARIGGLAGWIVVTPPRGDGADTVGVAFNTSRMARGVAIEGREPFVAVLPG